MAKRIKLVLSGSGTLYPVFVGAILRLAEAGYEIAEVCGTSGGALIAAALASGYKPNEELVKLIKNTLPAKNRLIDLSAFNLFMHMGLIKGDRIESMFGNYLAKTFKETKIPLHIVTTNIERKAARIFSTKDDPDVSIATVARASMSIPGVFSPVRIQNELYVDGGVTANYMIDLFGASSDVIGLRFGPCNSMSGDWRAAARTPIKDRDIAAYLSANLNSMLEATTREHIREAHLARTIFLNSKYGVLNFSVTERDVDIMKQEGYAAADAWLRAQ